jgi:hypothetical protein
MTVLSSLSEADPVSRLIRASVILHATPATCANHRLFSRRYA